MITKIILSLIGLFVFCYIFALVIIGFIFNDVADPPAEVQQVEPVSTSFNELDKRVFNENALNPTELIEIKESDNNSVFSIGEESTGTEAPGE